MKKYLPTSAEIRPSLPKFDHRIRSMKLVDMGAYRLLCSLKSGDVIELMGNKLSCIASTAMVRMRIEYKGVKINLQYALGNWHTGLKNKGYKLSSAAKTFNTLLRDIEGIMILDAVNLYNQFHKPTVVN